LEKEQQTTAPEEGQAAKTEVTGKQPYELSRAEYVQAGGLKMKGRAAEHKKAVAQAIAEGKITEHPDYPELSEPNEIFIRAAEKRDLARVQKSLRDIPEKFGYEKVYKRDGKQGRGFYYSKVKVKEIKAEKPASTPSGAQNLVTFLTRAGKIRLGEEFQDKTGDAWSRAHGFRAKDRSRELGDIAAVTSKNGKMAMDEAASFVNAEGFRDKNGEEFTDRTLYEALASGDARNILHPDKAESIIERKIRSLENDWIEKQLANLEEKADREAIEGSRGDIETGLSEVSLEEGITQEELDANQANVSDFFAEMAKEEPRTENTKAGKQVTIPGASAAETFSLNNPETDMSKHKPISEQTTPKNADMFGDGEAEKDEIKEWQDIPELDAQIRTIENPTKDFDKWTVQIGVQESLGERGGDILTQFYKDKPTLQDIKDDIIQHYKDEKIKINKEVVPGITAKSGREEIVEEAIDKVLETNKPESATADSGEELTPTTDTEYTPAKNLIHHDVAMRSHHGTSFDPEKEANRKLKDSIRN